MLVGTGDIRDRRPGTASDGSRLRLPALATALALGVALLTGCGGTKRATPTGTPAPAGLLLAVVAEAQETSQVQLFDPASGAARRTVASVAHRNGWGITASVSPNGRQLAYVVLPRDAIDPDTQGELWLLSLTSPSSRRLATGVDLRSELVWSPDSAWVSYVKVTAPSIDLRRVNASGAGDQSLAVAGPTDRWFLFGYTADGRNVELAHLTGAGTAFDSAEPGTKPQAEQPISSGSARGFVVSPAGRPALLALQDENGRQVYRALAQRQDGSFARLTQDGIEDTGIAWNPRSGEATVGVVPAAPGQPVPAAPGAHAIVPASGFDVPVAWSPDGALLALRHFSGASTDDPGTETIAVLSGSRRVELRSAEPLTIAGWAASRG
ncbi:MAG TPA: hypothetical protein VFD32_13095 [Dehalococcoidia bacterium]|nr:hypothetical protein [Dehalococcoidia bacterium]